MRRLIELAVLALLAALTVWAVLRLWDLPNRAEAARQQARADSLATELAAAEVRAQGYQTALARASSARDLYHQLSDSLAAVLTSYGARPTTTATVRASAAGSAVAPAPVVGNDTASVWEAWIEDGPLSLSALVDHPARRLSVKYWIETHGELVHALMPDGRLMVAARGLDAGVLWEVEELYWSPPTLEPRKFPWGCALSAGGTGAAAVVTKDWRVLAAGSLLTAWRCWPR